MKKTWSFRKVCLLDENWQAENFNITVFTAAILQRLFFDITILLFGMETVLHKISKLEQLK